MKVLIVADDKIVIDKISVIVQEYNYDIILYRWLLKALDNIEEVLPDIVIINAAEYPRHWKTLAQYCRSGIALPEPQILIAVNKHFSDAEYVKARELNVQTFSLSGSDTTQISLSQLLKILTTKFFIFTDPTSDTFVTGKIISHTGAFLLCSIDIKDQIKNLKDGMLIKQCTFRENSKIFSMAAVVIENKTNLKLKLQDF
jgi:DNA-binding NarL/FixJ family response regulator